jgi:superfamily II DNA/RNA helicase
LIRKENGIKIELSDASIPLTSFEKIKNFLGLESNVMGRFEESGYDTPTPIQMQIIPEIYKVY